jgi:L-2-hydroxyglutarate oxidase
MSYDFAIIGGGIIGLATAMTLSRRCPATRILLLEKEQHPSQHQSGRNSGLIHSGIYYQPGSYKARFAQGRRVRWSGSAVNMAFQQELPRRNEGDVPILGKVRLRSHPAAAHPGNKSRRSRTL